MGDLDFNSTLAIRKHFGLIKEGKAVYKREFDANNNGVVEDEEAWAFLARHVLSPNIQEFMRDEDFIAILVKDLENLPDKEKKFAQEIIYKNFAYQLKEPELTPEREEIKWPKVLKPYMALELGFGARLNVFPTEYSVSLENLPRISQSDQCCDYYCDSFSGNGYGSVQIDISLLLINMLSIGFGFAYSGTGEQTESDFDMVGPILEGRLPLVFRDKKETTHSLFITYIPFWTKHEILASSWDEDYTVATMRLKHFVQTGYYISWPYLTLKIGPTLSYKTLDIEKTEVEELDNQVNVHVEYPKFDFGFFLYFAGKIPLVR